MKIFLTLATTLLLSVTCADSFAWTLNGSESSVSFVTVKKTNIGETHRFSDISGSINDGAARVVIKPDSVDTRVPIRDERMREFLFETQLYPTIEIIADVSEVLETLKPGEKKLLTLDATLSLHGVSKPIALKIQTVRLSESTLLVSSTQPFLVRAKTFGMVEGITKLASLVNNLHISESVPVSFNMVFSQ